MYFQDFFLYHSIHIHGDNTSEEPNVGNNNSAKKPDHRNDGILRKLLALMF